MASYIHVNAETDEQVSDVLERLRGSGVEVVHTGEDNPIYDALFYVARINSKLDNLGQLRHLHKIQTSLQKIEEAQRQVGTYYHTLNVEKSYEQDERRKYYMELARTLGVKPQINYLYMSLDAIKRAFAAEVGAMNAEE
jgi:hypothetical protein